MCGVDEDKFWKSCPNDLLPYKLKNKMQQQYDNKMAYYQGIYFFNALSTIASNILAPKGTPPKHYMEEPLQIFPLTEEEKAQKVEIERQKAIAFFTSMVPSKDN